MQGCLNTDLYFTKHKVAYLDAGKPFPFPDAAFEYIYSEHMFERLKFAQGLNMLGECFRVLKPGGDIRLATPDIDFLIKLYTDPHSELHKQYIRWATATFVPEVTAYVKEDECSAAFVVNNFFRNWGHEALYHYQGLESVLRKHGFIQISRKQVGESEIATFKTLRSMALSFHRNSTRSRPWSWRPKNLPDPNTTSWIETSKNQCGCLSLSNDSKAVCV